MSERRVVLNKERSQQVEMDLNELQDRHQHQKQLSQRTTQELQDRIEGLVKDLKDLDTKHRLVVVQSQTIDLQVGCGSEHLFSIS
jgi:hypothetical protein